MTVHTRSQSDWASEPTKGAHICYFNWILSALGSRHSANPKSTDENTKVQGGFVEALELGPIKEGFSGEGISSCRVWGSCGKP